MDQPVDVPYAMILMMPELRASVVGEGTDEQGRHYMIQRYDSHDGRVFQCVFVGADTPKCTQLPETPAE